MDETWGKMINDLPFPVQEYNMCIENRSTFLDIGSGFGKPNFHAAMQTGCHSRGVEVVPARVSFATDQKYTFEEYYKLKIEQRQHIQGSNKVLDVKKLQAMVE